MKINVNDGLPYIKAKLMHGEKNIFLSNFLIDTGSASTLISADIAIELGLGPSPQDKIYTVQGVGGTEFVYEKCIDRLEVGK